MYHKLVAIENIMLIRAMPARSIAGMDSEQTTAIVLGPVKLLQQNGQLLAMHKSLKEPMQIDPLQLQRWLLRQLREQVAA